MRRKASYLISFFLLPPLVMITVFMILLAVFLEVSSVFGGKLLVVRQY